MKIPAATAQEEIGHSKLKRNCIHYIIAGHRIKCCLVSGDPKCFTDIDQCVECKDYQSSNKKERDNA